MTTFQRPTISNVPARDGKASIVQAGSAPLKAWRNLKDMPRCRSQTTDIGTVMTHATRPKDWYDIGKDQGIRAGRRGVEVQRHQSDFVNEDENAAWIDGVLEGVLSVGARIAAVTSVQDVMPGSKGGIIQVIMVERLG
jgi:hypothetical protein